MLIRDAFGSYVQVKSVSWQTLESCRVVKLDVGGGVPTLTVTDSHRIVKKAARRSVVTCAGDLQQGDEIQCSDGQSRILEHVHSYVLENVDVCKAAFKPDSPILAFDV